MIKHKNETPTTIRTMFIWELSAVVRKYHKGIPDKVWWEIHDLTSGSFEPSELPAVMANIVWAKNNLQRHKVRRVEI